MDALRSAKRFTHYFIITVTLAFLSACTSPLTPKDYPPALFSELNNNSAFFLQKAEEADQPESVDWQLVAIQALVTENKPIIANSIIDYLQSQILTVEQQSALNLLIADNLNIQNRTNEALTVLDRINSNQLSEIGRLHFLKLQIQLQIDKNMHLDASDNLLLLTPLLQSADEIQHYHDILFAQLILLPADLLNPEQAVEQTTRPTAQVKQGWYQLASLYQQYQLRPNQLIRSIEEWKLQNPTHPAMNFMPTLLTSLPELSPYQPENIAVLLPLSGRFKQQGQAIQYGLLHAYYQQQAKTNAVPTTFHFFDTLLHPMEEIVAQFKAQHIDFVIGPLLKNNIEKFLPLVDKMPVLALNSFPKEAPNELPGSVTEAITGLDHQKIAWHYAFPLSPEEEAKQAAQWIFSQHHKKPLLIAPDSAYGARIAKAFTQEWASLNAIDPSTVENYFFNQKAQLAPFIAEVLQTDASQRRINQMKVITQLPLETKLRSRRDVDAIYIISKRNELIMLKAFIDVSISPFAETIPLYASSRSHLYDDHNKELANITFSDSPFLLDENNQALKEIQQSWGKESLTKLRLFALGFDSYQLIGQLIELQSNEDISYKGLVGQLSLDDSNTIEAKLNWAKYLKGKRIEITAPVSAE